MTDLEKILQRFERGYTATLYGTVDLANFQKEYDFMELVQIVKKLTIHSVSNRRGLLLAFSEYWNKCDNSLIEETNIDEFLKSK